MKITFVGDPSGAPNPPVCRMYGYEFPVGEAVEVPDEQIAEKLSRNSHFTAGGTSAEGSPAPIPRRRRRKPVEPAQPELVTDDHAHQE